MIPHEPIRIGTRASALARTQTGWVATRLAAVGADVSIVTLSTRGDERRDVPVTRIGGDGVFVRELEQALLEGRIDAAVHSLKDMPTAETPGLAIVCVPERATPFDAVVGRTAARLEDLPPGAVVGTSSIRRIVQVQRVRSDLVVAPVRGNVDTRLRRLDAGEYDALILAAAGLERLGLAGRVTQMLPVPSFWPAVAQGALAIQVRADDSRAREAVLPLDHAATHAAVRAERRLLAELAGGCLAPIGAWARVEGSGHLALGGCVLDVDETTGRVRRICAAEQVPLEGGADGFGEVSDRGRAETLGALVAGELLAAGAEAMLAHMRVRTG
jgi:hydroxymethylbilane synthase